MAKQDVTAERAARLVEALRRQREQGGGAYPLSVARLRELADPQASDEEVRKALAKKPHAEQVAVADRKDPAGPVALAEDSDSLAGSPLLLEFALGKVCSAERPLVPLAKVAGAVDRALREKFTSAVRQQAEEARLPDFAGARTAGGKVQLYLRRFPPPPEPQPPAVELAEKLVRALAAARDSGGAYPAAPGELARSAGAEVKPALVRKALAEEAFRSGAVVAVPGDPDSPAALAEDYLRLADSPALLAYLLKGHTSARKPTVPLDQLAEKVAPDLRTPFADSVRRRAQESSLPEGVGASAEGGELRLYLTANVPAHVMLAGKLLDALRRAREEGGDSYPATPAELARRADPGAPPEAVKKALAEKGLKAQVVPGVAGNADAPAALAGDEEVLANSPRLLEFAVGLLSTPERPLHPVARVAGKVDKRLRPAFESAIERRVREGDWPASVAFHEVKGKPHLRLTRHPLPRPADEALAEKLVESLRAARDSGAYPVPLRELIEQAGAEAGERVVKKALKHRAFAEAVVWAVPGDRGAPVALAEDRARLAGDPRLLESALSAARSEDNQALAPGDLAKKVAKGLRDEFAEGVRRRVEEGSLPAGVGVLRIKKKPYLFLTEDLRTGPAPAPAPPPERRGEPAGEDFARRFEEAFDRLDRERGSANLVSLVRLRQELPADRATFDAELRRLRRAGRYTLSAAEGRHGLNDEERAAGLAEDGALLLYVSRRE
jgi:hypothetical protein